MDTVESVAEYFGVLQARASSGEISTGVDRSGAPASTKSFERVDKDRLGSVHYRIHVYRDALEALLALSLMRVPRSRTSSVNIMAATPFQVTVTTRISSSGQSSMTINEPTGIVTSIRCPSSM
jgi:hypothetical protein